MNTVLSLEEALRWVVNLGGAALVAYYLVGNVSVLADLRADYKRYAALALAFLIGDLGYLVQVGMLYTPQPLDYRAWVEALFAAGATAAMGNQIVHGVLQLRPQAIAKEKK